MAPELKHKLFMRIHKYIQYTQHYSTQLTDIRGHMLQMLLSFEQSLLASIVTQCRRIVRIRREMRVQSLRTEELLADLGETRLK